MAAKTILQWQDRLPNAVVRLPHAAPTHAELEQIRADLSTSVIADSDQPAMKGVS
ncbi:hypothetical protein QJS66_06600 [Kocuria rhizophila]|nr:hypothetical protein QJS66_06600 [Kocuria rhizophila]